MLSIVVLIMRIGAYMYTIDRCSGVANKFSNRINVGGVRVTIVAATYLNCKKPVMDIVTVLIQIYRKRVNCTLN